MSKVRYRVRYTVELGDFAKPEGGKLVRPGIRKSKNKYGYADDLFIASVVRDGDQESYLLLSTEGDGPAPSVEMLMAVREQIDHYLSHHAGERP